MPVALWSALCRAPPAMMALFCIAFCTLCQEHPDYDDSSTDEDPSFGPDDVSLASRDGLLPASGAAAAEGVGASTGGLYEDRRRTSRNKEAVSFPAGLHSRTSRARLKSAVPRCCAFGLRRNEEREVLLLRPSLPGFAGFLGTRWSGGGARRFQACSPTSGFF